MRTIPTLAVGLVVVGGILPAAGFGGTTDRGQQVVPETAPAAAPRPDPVPVASLSFDAATRAAETLPRLYSLLVSVDGELRAEHYFNGATPRRATNIKSASKSIVATL